jgi:molecular chaperone GrpE (heat shock protein)
MKSIHRRYQEELLKAKKRMVSEVITKLNLIDDLRVFKIVKEMNFSEKEAMKKVCDMICSNLDNVSDQNKLEKLKNKCSDYEQFCERE